jgi:hypothetical protein
LITVRIAGDSDETRWEDFLLRSEVAHHATLGRGAAFFPESLGTLPIT